MSTAKRERQRENRRLRLAADEAAAKQYTTRRRIKLIGIAAVVVAAALAVLGFLQRGSDSDDESETAATSPESSETDTADLADAEQPDAETPDTETPDTETPDAETPDAEQATELAVDAEQATEAAVDTEQSPDTETPETAVEGCPAVDGSGARVIDFDGPQPMCIDPGAGYVAVFDTSEGEMRFELTPSETPQTVNNFVTLARFRYYDDTLLFRTDPSIDIIQGGSPHTNDNRDPGPGYTIPDEPAFEFDPDTGQLTGPYRYQPGQLVMARSAGPDSGSAQFFLTTGPNTALLDSQGTYVVFGRTDDAGLAVAQSIIGLHEPGGDLGGAPSRDVTVHSVTIEQT